MSLTKSVARNMALQIFGRTLGTMLGLFAIAILTRYLGPAGYGGFTTVTSFLQFFGVLVDFGLTLTAVQMISKPEADEGRIMSSILGLRLVSAIIFFGLAPVAVFFFPYPAAVKLGVAVGSLAYLCMTLSQVLGGIFQKRLRMGSVVMAEVIGRAVLLAGIWLAATTNSGLVYTIWALVAGNVVQLIIILVTAQHLVRFRPRLEPSILRQIIRQSWPIGLSIAFNLIYLKGDVVFLSLFRSQAEVGIYGAAYKVLDVITVIPMMFMGLVLPLLVSAWSSDDRQTFARRLRTAFDFSALLAMPLAGGTLVLGNKIMELVAGREFIGSGAILKILIIAGLAVFFSGLYGHAVIAVGKQRVALWGYGLTAALALGAYAIFVPRAGALGAAAVTVFSEIFIAIYTFILVTKTTRIFPRPTILLKSICSTLIMMEVLTLLPTLPVLILVMLGILVYGLALLLLRAVSLDEIRSFLKP